MGKKKSKPPIEAKMGKVLLQPALLALPPWR